MPTSPNVVLQVPNTGDLRDIWGLDATNPNFEAIDGMFGGVVSIAVSNAPYTLSAPSGSVAPTPGPFESQNAVIQLSGVLTADVQITLPLPGRQTIANFCTTTTDRVVTLKAAGSGQVVGLPDGAVTDVYNDGTNVKFLHGFGVFPGKQEFVAGFSALPRWITLCTVQPYVMADGTIYNIATYPNLAQRFGTAFGGNGFTTFGVPDLRGRVPLMYDGTGTRITTAGSGINGQTIGAAGGEQNHTLTVPEIPSHNHTLTDPGHSHTYNDRSISSVNLGGNNQVSTTVIATTTGTSTTGITIAAAGGGGAHNNVQPAQVTGIWLIKT